MLTTYQIYFSPEQVGKLEPQYIPYFNANCTEYFEHSVMAELILEGKHQHNEYFAVVSYKLREKIGSVMKERWKNIPAIANHSSQEWSPKLFEAALAHERPDVMSFQRHMGHDPVLVAERFHPGFRRFWEHITSRIGLEWKPTHLDNVSYCNFFAARSELYGRYVEEALIPAMKVMDGMDELWRNSGYSRPLPGNLREKWGINHWPYHAFLCERLFSWWAYKNNLTWGHF